MTELEQVVINSPRLSERTKEIYLKNIRVFLQFAGTDPANWTGGMVENWRDLLAKKRKPQTVNGYLSALRYASKRRAQRNGNPLLDFAVVAELLPIKDQDPPRALTVEEGQALIEACKGRRGIDIRDMAIVMLGLHTGLRRAGICGITFEDCRGRDIEVTLKGGKRHVITLDDETLSDLTRWIGWLRERGITSGAMFRNIAYSLRDDGAIGDGLTTDGLYRALKSRAAAAGIPDFSPHVFRHTFVSWARQAGVPDYRIMAVTGHRIDTTLDTYTTDLKQSDDPVGSRLPRLK